MLRLVFPIVLVGCAIFLVQSATTIRISPYDPVGGQIFPLYASYAMLVLSAVYLIMKVREIFAERRQPSLALAVAEAAPPQPIVKPLALLGLFACVVALVCFRRIGLEFAIAFLTVAGSLIILPQNSGRRGFVVQIVAAILAATILIAFTHFVIGQALGIRLP